MAAAETPQAGHGILFVAQVPYCLARLIDGGTNLHARMVEKIFLQCEIFTPQAGDRLQQRRDAGAALDHGVMHLSRQAVALFENRFEAEPQGTDARLVNRENQQGGRQQAKGNEPPRTVEVRLLFAARMRLLRPPRDCLLQKRPRGIGTYPAGRLV